MLLSGTYKKEWVVLLLTGHMHWDAGILTAVFSCAHLVHQLSACELPPDSVLAICTALAALSADSAPRLFPLLSTLRFEEVDFGCPDHGCDGDRSAIPHLTDALVARAEDVHAGQHWHSIHHLHIEGCSLAESAIEEWEEYVPHLFWDGETGGRESHTDSGNESDSGSGNVIGVDGVMLAGAIEE